MKIDHCFILVVWHDYFEEKKNDDLERNVPATEKNLILLSGAALLCQALSVLSL